MSEENKKTSHATIRTPLARAKGLGSAKEGVHHWWAQRVSAVALVPLSLYWLWRIGDVVARDYSAFISFIGDPFVSIAAVLFIVAAFHHAMLGMQVIIEDYIAGKAIRVACLTLNKLAFWFMGFACVFAVVYINFALYGRTP